ncbi:MAG TPA: site-2 protease family protein [Candidatus Acidoferrales bacterium]|jgi:Zn-dependent protease|nr:site-2 protease family protein [Candidatus Acidoferrales bacterium]
MFRHTISLGRIFGIRIDLDYSWFLIVGLLTWVLAANYYPQQFKDWSTAEYWGMGLATAVMLFVSVLIHELGHSLVAQHLGMSVPRITLFIFGGVSQIATEPPSAGAEFAMAIVGPLVSLALAAVFWELEPVVAFSGPLLALTQYLALLNFVLGIFNLVPGFPLDGGRVLRAIIWRFTGKYQRSTAIAAGVGRFCGFLLIFVGLWQILGGNFLNGLWIAFIGWFLESAAASLLQQEGLKSLIGEHRVADAMRRDFPQVPADLTVQDLVDKHVFASGARYFIVNGNGAPAGLVTLADIKQIPRPSWSHTAVSQLMVPLQRMATIKPDALLWSALEKMGRDGVNQLPVVDGNGIVGVLSRDDVMHYLGVLQAIGR